ncbi:SpoIIIAH-like family protein [Bacillus sp. FJAT-45350]|uniref:SpoIIIAH-like family protein n=1 Tax=Bacillus sp. FJAT-45350 TaxID=2011014 RepID=UPI000BB715AA|nr:SpoIIIAH-like family protein [Bacillus sp. FJAT-45350]
MVLKKQTIWLLTMLSLIIVLSVYYITAPGQTGDQMAFLEEEEAVNEELNFEEAGQVSVNIEEELDINLEEELDEAGVISSIASDEVFTSIRLDRQESRERMQEEYTNIIASTDAPEEIRTSALESKENLLQLEQKEQMLETLIRSKGYDDVLVITQEEQVKIIVKADELTREQANEILLMAGEQLGHKHVAVQFQAGN